MARKTKTPKEYPGAQVLTWPEIGSKVEIFGVTGRFRGRVLKESLGEYEVHGPCERATAGHWYCITHREHFDNQLSKDVHIGRGAHELVWCCDLHGMEVSANWGKPDKGVA